jgi:hypothetical protein
VLAIAVPQGVTGATALLSSAIGFLAGEQGTIPLAILLVLTTQLVGFAVTHREEPAALRWSWVVGFVATAVLMPILAIHVTLAHQPYAGTASGSRLPLLATTGALAVLLIATAIVLAILSYEVPEEAGLLLMPAALLVPTMIGIRGAVTEASSVQALGVAALVAAAATGLAWSLPRQSRMLVPPCALAVQFVLLWMMDRGPTIQSSSGSIVPLTQGGLLALTVILVVCVPILALWVRGLSAAAEAREREPTLPELEAFR